MAVDWSLSWEEENKSYLDFKCIIVVSEWKHDDLNIIVASDWGMVGFQIYLGSTTGRIDWFNSLWYVSKTGVDIISVFSN